MENKAPWLQFYTDIRKSLDYPRVTLSEAFFNAAEKDPEGIALIYMGRRFTFSDVTKSIRKTCALLCRAGVKRHDRIAVCLPNIPQAVYLLYAADMLGAVVSFLHPLSAMGEFARYFEELDAKCVVALEGFYSVIEKAFSKSGERTLVLTSPADELGLVKRSAYKLTEKNKGNKPFDNSGILYWRQLMKKSDSKDIKACKKSADDTALVLFSGGTTGEAKGVMLSALGLNAMSMQTIEMSHCNVQGKSMLAAMPMFHGFGLAVSVHSILIHGGTVILIPRFTVKEYALLIKKYRPNFIAGVPTLFEALLREPAFSKVDLSCLSGVFSGGDTLPIALKKKFDGFLKTHGASVRIREGYGATECVTASCLTPYNIEREGSIGIPFPDTYYKICKVGSTQEVPYGTEGEICIHSVAMMKGYLNSPEETAKVLKTHHDSKVWLHTGDVGMMDKDGFVYFKGRIKRIIVSRGYNIYPTSIEQILDNHDKIEKSCVVGVKDPYKMQSVKAYIVPRQKEINESELKKEILEYCAEHIARYAIPSQIEFISEMPVTKAGKTAYAILEEKANNSSDEKAE